MRVLDGPCPDEKVLVVEGVLNIETAFRFRDFVREHESANAVLDLTNVRYIDSSGLGALIGAYVSFERNCKRLLLAGMSDRVWDVFRTSKLNDVFTRYATVAEAQAMSAALPAANATADTIPRSSSAARETGGTMLRSEET